MTFPSALLSVVFTAMAGFGLFELILDKKYWQLDEELYIKPQLLSV